MRFLSTLYWNKWLSCALLVLPATAVTAATVPYTETFEDDAVGITTPSEPAPESGTFSVLGAGGWSVLQVGANHVYQNVFTADNTSSLALIKFAGSLGGPPITASDFTMSVDFVFRQKSDASIGFGILMDSLSLTGHVVDLNLGTGAVRVVTDGLAHTFTGIPNTLLVGQTYTLTLSGGFVDADENPGDDAVQLYLKLDGPNAPSQPIYLGDQRSVDQTGTYFGLRDRNFSGDTNVEFDNFNIRAGAAIPEPTSGLLVVAATGALICRRGRRRVN